nr:hypothetical protein BaRGS_022951 [Batillaria attramentaria]
MSHFQFEKTVTDLTRMDGPLQNAPMMRWQRKAQETLLRVHPSDNGCSSPLKPRGSMVRTPGKNCRTPGKGRTPGKNPITPGSSKKTKTPKVTPGKHLTSKTPNKKPGVTPGKQQDRFIPNRVTTDIDMSHFALLNLRDDGDGSGSDTSSNTSVQYQQQLAEAMLPRQGTQDAKILSFKNVCSVSNQPSNLNVLYSTGKVPTVKSSTTRQIPTKPEHVLDAPVVLDDYYLHTLDWSSTNVVAAALGSEIYLWNASNSSITLLMNTEEENYVSGVSWMNDGSILAIGISDGRVQLWDVNHVKLIRTMNGHAARVGCLDWNAHILTSGGNDNAVNVWDTSLGMDVRPLHTFTEHQAAIKVCSVLWSKEHRELVSGHGYSQNQLSLWKYPNMSKITDLIGQPFNVSAPTDPGDENTTNIYVGNINPKMTEQQLCEVFGKYGPLASIKIMWPRTEEERARGRNCGFVAFMNRKDGERAMNALRGKEVQGFEMKLGWGKAVPIPQHPIYIPPALAELTQPPPPSGLPFNAQPLKKKRDRDRDRDRDRGDRDRGGYGSVPPPGQSEKSNSRDRDRERDRDRDRDRDSSSDKREESEDMEKTLANAVVKVVIPTERFLFENQSPNHIYYRWKLFSIFSQRDRLEDMLRELSPEKSRIGEVMVCFQAKLKDIFKDVHEVYEKIEGRLKAEQFKQAQSPEHVEVPASDLDGAPIEDLDGAPLEAPLDSKPLVEDIDGEVLSEDLDGMPLNQSESSSQRKQEAPVVPVPAFTRSKWESVDETELEAQAMTTSKWDMLEQESDGEKEIAAKGADEDIDGAPMEVDAASNSDSSDDNSEDLNNSQRQEMTEERRAKLREIEMKVVKYQDDLEMGRRSRKSQMSLSEQVEHYRKKLLSKDKVKVTSNTTPGEVRVSKTVIKEE